MIALLIGLAQASTYTETLDFAADAGPMVGGTVVEGRLRVTDAAARLPMSGATTVHGRVVLRLVEGAAFSLSLGAGSAFVADYSPGGGLRLGESHAPMPRGHYAWEVDWLPILDVASGWEAADVLHPELVYDAATATFLLYYTGAMAPGYGYRQIGLATSTDGLTWTRAATNPVVPISWDLSTYDGVHAHMPTVTQKADGSYAMVYACYENSRGNRLCGASSPDGLTWTRSGVLLDFGAAGAFDDGSLREPDLTVDEDGTYHLLYNGTRPDEHYGPTGYATSVDGITWTKQGAISAGEDEIKGGSVLQGVYGLEQWWNCADAICYAAAETWTDWTQEEGPEIAKGWAPWNAHYLQAPSVVRVGDTLHMVFNALDYPAASPHEAIGHAWTEPRPGQALTLDLDWDGAVFSVTEVDHGLTLSAPLASVEGLELLAVGVAEVDSLTMTWTVDDPPVDTGAGEDTGPAEEPDSDTPADSGPDEAAPDGSEDGTDRSSSGKGGCAAPAGGAPGALLSLFALVGLFGRRAAALRGR
jgi:predicted GH43/DUF377 family glycosyl hydrolase